MKSKIDNSSSDLLIVIGGGIAAGFAPYLVTLFVQGGFKTRIALTPESTGWVAPETLKKLCRAPVLTDELQLLRPEDKERFDIVLVLGATSAMLSDFANGVVRSPAAELAAASNKPVFVLHEQMPSETESILESCSAKGFVLQELPKVIGRWHSEFERFFSAVILFISRRKALKSVPFLLSRTVPSALTSLAGAAPKWMSDLKACLLKFGFQEVTNVQTNEKCIHIETYEGPFVATLKKSKGNAATYTVTLDPYLAENIEMPSQEAVKIRFLHIDAPQTAVDRLKEVGYIIVRRKPEGHLVVSERSGERLIPNLTAQAAFFRFAELLADRFS